MQFIKLMLSGFRSWERVTFEFQPGLTTLCGVNGAGKSSIRMGAQYAITGAVPKHTKGELVKENTKTPFSVELHMLTDEEEKLVLRRTSNKTTLTVGSEDASIRENSYLSRLRTALYHTFLSPDQAAFVDVQDFKRKEMLYELIPEVAMLRAVCVPRLKDHMKRYYKKRTNVMQNVYNVEAVISEQRRAVAVSQQNYQQEISRLKKLEESMQAELPFTQEEADHFSSEVARLSSDVDAYQKYINEATAWVEKAAYTNNLNASVTNTYNALVTALNNTRNQIAAYADISDSAPQAVKCTCGADLRCAVCDEPVVVKNVMAQANTDTLTALRNKEAQLILDVEKQGKLVEAANIVDSGEIQKVRNEINRAQTAINTLTTIKIENQGKLQQYNIAKQNLAAVRDMRIDKRTAESIKAAIDDTMSRIEASEKVLERKKKSLEIMTDTEKKMQLAVDAMNTTLPAIYFDHFLTQLTTYCNYLLDTISKMEMEMTATDDGIHIKVDGRNFHQLSSGERQRVRTATTLAFSLLSKQSDTLFIDEVFDAYIDEDGIEDLATMLTTVVRNFYAKVIVVTHQPYLTTALHPDHIVFVEKDENETSQISKTVRR